MKLLKYIFFPSALLLCLNTNFAHALPPKGVMLPFKNVELFSKTHAGLLFNYDMFGVPKRKVVCKLDHVYKGWFEFPNEGVVDESPTYGGDQIVILTNTDPRNERDKHADVLHADRAGTISIHALKQGRRSKAVVSCFYEDAIMYKH